MSATPATQTVAHAQSPSPQEPSGISRKIAIGIGASVFSGVLIALTPFSLGATTALLPAAAGLGGWLGSVVHGWLS